MGTGAPVDIMLYRYTVLFENGLLRQSDWNSMTTSEFQREIGPDRKIVWIDKKSVAVSREISDEMARRKENYGR